MSGGEGLGGYEGFDVSRVDCGSRVELAQGATKIGVLLMEHC